MPRRWILIVLLFCQIARSTGEGFSVGTYNIENYLDSSSTERVAKTPESKAKVREYILSFKPDVLALQEIGSVKALEELRSSLRGGGLNYPHALHVDGPDPHINLAFLSKFPITSFQAHTNLSYLLRGRRFRVSRGFAEAQFELPGGYKFTAVCAHLKSRRPSPVADEAEMREQEALLLRERIDQIFARDPAVNLIVLGDLNDIPGSKPLRITIGRGATRLFDTRPSERNGDTRSEPGRERSIAWTHFYAQEDSYSRPDYILISRGMAQEWDRAKTFLPTRANWGVASDHRPIVASFDTSGFP